MWTNSEHIAEWWGPSGFTTKVHKMDLKPGGEWLLSLYGPEGNHFPNKSIFMVVDYLKRIEFEHFNPKFYTTVIFEEADGSCKLNWRLEFETVEMFDIVVKAHKADEGLKQNILKLESYLNALHT